MRSATAAVSRGCAGLIALLLLIVAAAPLHAQSPFALVNIGADIRQSDARTAGRGGWGLAESDSLNPCFLNIAGLPGLGHTAILYSGYAEMAASSTPDAERVTSNVRAPNLRAAVPVGGRMVLTGGFRALRGTQYKSMSTFVDTLGNPALTDQFLDIVEGETTFVREGTQFEVPLGAAFRAASWLSAGISVNLVRGVIRAHLSRAYDELYLPNVEMQEDDVSGTSTTVSLLLEPSSRFSVGATLTPSHRWDIVRTRSMSSVSDNSETPYRVELPAVWSVGAKAALGERWRLGGDFESQPFTSFEGNYWANTMVDAWRLAVGVERREEWRRRGGLGNLPLRAGFTVSRWPYTINGEPLTEKRISVGTGVPFRQRSGHLDVALSYAWVGDMDTHGIEDRVWRFSVSMVGLEKWW